MAKVIVQSPVINQVVITEEDKTVLVQTPMAGIATVITEGPQGPPGFGINDIAKVDASVVYYDASAQQFKADATWTVSTLTDGGNF
jgi:hypothetical protein